MRLLNCAELTMGNNSTMEGQKMWAIPLVYLLLLSFWLVSFNAYGSIVPNPKERIEYWRKNYRELTPEQDPRVEKAQEIFDRVLSAAGSRHGVHPCLHIIAKDPLNITLPISIPDGWVVLSKRVLDLCYHEDERGDDRFAFIVAHEIAHLLDDDFWHMNFFNAIDLSKRRGLADEMVLNQIRGIVGETDKVQAKELRADEKGILFASMAGFNTVAITGQGQEPVSFFAQWESLLNPKRIKQLKTSQNSSLTHPTSLQRHTAVLTRLRQVSARAEMFNLGLLFYQMGEFKKAIDAFSDFQRDYPGREVHHNLAISYHQEALRLLGNSNGNSPTHFKLALTIDPETRASAAAFRGPRNYDQRYKQNMEAAIEFYRLAIEQDPSYLLAYKNLGSAYIVNGEPFKAIAILKDGLRLKANDPSLLNALGVAFYFSENSGKARQYLTQALKLAPNFSDPLYNLGLMSYMENNIQQARGYWTQYVALDSGSNWTKSLRKKYKIGPEIARARGLVTLKNEMISGLQIGNYNDEVPRD